MVINSSDISLFVSNSLGNIFLIIGGLIGIAKWLESRQNKKIKEEVELKIKSEMANLSNEINKLSSCIEKQTEVTETQIEWLKNAVEHFQRLEENRTK